MPRWLSLGRQFTALRRRYNLNVPLGELLTGILPTVEIDKHYPDDTLDLWGMFSQAVGDAVNLESCSLVAGAREVLVHRVDVWDEGTGSANGIDWHMFTPLQTYNPVGVAAQSVQFPWAQMKANTQDTGQLSRAFGLSGTAAGLQVVTINGVPVTSVGPVYSGQVFVVNTAVGTSPIKAWEAQNPPLRIKPFGILTVQVLQPTFVNHLMNVNWWYTERDPQGDIG